MHDVLKYTNICSTQSIYRQWQILSYDRIENYMLSLEKTNQFQPKYWQALQTVFKVLLLFHSARILFLCIIFLAVHSGKNRISASPSANNVCKLVRFLVQNHHPGWQFLLYGLTESSHLTMPKKPLTSSWLELCIAYSKFLSGKQNHRFLCYISFNFTGTYAKCRYLYIFNLEKPKPNTVFTLFLRSRVVCKGESSFKWLYYVKVKALWNSLI